MWAGKAEPPGTHRQDHRLEERWVAAEPPSARELSGMQHLPSVQIIMPGHTGIVGRREDVLREVYPPGIT